MLIYLSLLETDDEKEYFKKIYENNRLKMYYIAFSILKQKEESENAVQETFLRLADKFHKYKNLSEEKMAALCVTIVKHICIDYIRIRNHYSEKEFEEIVLYEDLYKNKYIDYTIENIPSEIYEKKEEMRKLSNCLEKLSEEYKIVLMLKYIYEFKTSEISKMLNVPLKTIDTRLSRAKEKMRNLLGEEV